jgi:hypothetical protein
VTLTSVFIDESYFYGLDRLLSVPKAASLAKALGRARKIGRKRDRFRDHTSVNLSRTAHWSVRINN